MDPARFWVVDAPGGVRDCQERAVRTDWETTRDEAAYVHIAKMEELESNSDHVGFINPRFESFIDGADWAKKKCLGRWEMADELIEALRMCRFLFEKLAKTDKTADDLAMEGFHTADTAIKLYEGAG